MTEPERAVDPLPWADVAASPSSPDSIADHREVNASPLWRALLAYAVLCLLTGVVSGALWNWMVDLPSYHVDDQGVASISERGLTEMFAADARFTLMGIVMGVLLGLAGWMWFRRLGWPVTLVVMVGSLLAAVVCWKVGEAMGPGAFDARISAAQPGDTVPIAFRLNSHTGIVVWMLAALAPVLLWSSLGREFLDDEPEPVRPGPSDPDAIQRPGQL
ncbi:MAG TPA: hypothetical protein PKN27_07080 [Propionibacteriaceae bacterium]|nr:hypothetical protein [Propionibacteriaceae bacterium]